MEHREDLARRILLDREYFNEVQRCVVLTGVSFDQLHQRCTRNIHHTYVAFENIDNRVFSKHGHGRIGRPASFDLGCTQYNGLGEFEGTIFAAVQTHDLYRADTQYINAKHLVYDQPQSRLSETVKDLLMRLLDQYMPIGILHIDQVLDAEDILDAIKQSLDANEHVDISLSEEFYRIIAQNEFTEPLEVIDNRRMYQNKMDALNKLRSALEVIGAGVESRINPIDYFKRYWLCTTEISEIDRNGVQFSQFGFCFQATQHPNDMFFRLTNVFEVASSADIEFENDMPNQCLLYHFVFPCKILGILRDGLQVTPNHRTNSLGNGIYFSDCASLALSEFTKPSTREMSPVLLLCRVARGVVYNVEPGNVSPLPNGKNSFFCEGRLFSNVTSATANFGDVPMYCGQIDQSCGIVNSDNYNMYMVQNRNQVKIEYILQFQRV